MKSTHAAESPHPNCDESSAIFLDASTKSNEQNNKLPVFATVSVKP
jgi:hypothetical protein